MWVMMVLKHRRDSMPKNTETQQWVVDEGFLEYVHSIVDNCEKVLWDNNWDTAEKVSRLETYQEIRDLRDFVDDILKGGLEEKHYVTPIKECYNCGEPTLSTRLYKHEQEWWCESCITKDKVGRIAEDIRESLGDVEHQISKLYEL
jgi:hypothetical protein